MSSQAQSDMIIIHDAREVRTDRRAPVGPPAAGPVVIVKEQAPQREAHAEQKSIVVSKSDGPATDKRASAPASDGSAALQPIANVSEYEPDLAEPRGLVPDLADPTAHERVARVAPVAVEPKRRRTAIEPEAVSFHGITPGISHRRDVLVDWGDPRTEDTMSPTLNYRFEQLRAVDVAFDQNTVEAIRIQLEQAEPLLDLVDRLDIHDLDPTEYYDSATDTLALVYPERGVVLAVKPESILDASFDPAATLIDQIIIQTIRSDAFIERAEQLRTTDLTQSIADLEQVIRLDRSQAEARWLLSQLYLDIGRTATAERYAHEAVELDPDNLQFRIQEATCLRHLGAHRRAQEKINSVLVADEATRLVRAQALFEKGHLTSLTVAKPHRESVALFTEASQLADRVVSDGDAREVLAARKLLVDAHLAVAVEVARSNWKEKDRSVSQWITRASGLAEALIADDDTYLALRLEVALAALTAACHMERPVDPLLWIEEAEHTAAALRANTSDPLLVNHSDWQLGMAYFHACQVQHRRSKSASATTMGERSAELLQSLVIDRSEQPDSQTILGRLYFQLGAVCAVHEKDHKAACRWYDEALELLLNPEPVTPLVPLQNGDAMVSMGVSYWNIGEREHAVELTLFGAELIEQAVEDGKLEPRSLSVPYGNLASMYKALGDKESAARYQRLSRK